MTDDKAECEHCRAVAIEITRDDPADCLGGANDPCGYCEREVQRVADLIIRERAAAREEAQAWQPIETGPQDGTRVLLWLPGTDARVVVGNWIATEPQHPSDPTHWMPLPKGPQP